MTENCGLLNYLIPGPKPNSMEYPLEESSKLGVCPKQLIHLEVERINTAITKGQQTSRVLEYVWYKIAGKLLRRSTRGGGSDICTECQFDDGVALLASTREGAEQAIMKYVDVADSVGLSVSLANTKLTVAAWT